MTDYPVIQTPKGTVLVNTDTMKAELIFYTDSFTGVKRGGPGPGYGGAQSWQGAFHEAQGFVDNEVLRLCDPFIPMKTGMLIKSGILGTEIGSGIVRWIAPYAGAQYYMIRKNLSTTGPLRGPYWFERMKQIYKKSILKGAKKIVRRSKE